ncbi:aromatic ring-hydroxylating dioxygenase subunit alpha [Aestuariicella hydrocarbonica]|uniref:Aromatic ring-hydroxylating dioxygenase subunit alpha n=1 Tax=Pseudomaricurvus hydrocarbonicus TaxID=1470433 RepID=A0A9E5JV48_9GAMM|nr:aromatic ring-hydroxylating dioxygenase subunit alpha [Aestuariicella hydrocarbonica]NHO66016.1 aromatic ring-hydroxylating dioxygenase subunit alpha [Aestuariicella hydrocarbonica]
MRIPTVTDHGELTDEDLAEPLTYPVEAFISPEYVQREKELLWPKVWQMAARLEDIPNEGDFITYNIGDESFIIMRSTEDTLRAFYNVCPHRGRQLVNTPDDVNCVKGRKKNFVCGFHGWTFNRDGENTSILDKDDWKGVLDEKELTCLSQVKVDTWGGWIYINMDPDCEPLSDFLGEAGRILSHFEFEKMRYKWRQWAVYPCNWKTAIEAFMEPYHVAGTHTQLLKYGEFYAYSKPYGYHGVSGFDERDAANKNSQSSSVTRTGRKDQDPRISTYELIRENYETVNYAASTETLVNAAKRLVDELPEGTPGNEVIAHLMKSAKADDAARGVIWPEIPPEVMSEAGLAWSMFPNQTILQGVTFALCYRVRPYGDDPDKCIFESYALERFPEGEEPNAEWVHAEPTAEKWGSVLAQDFDNMEWVQRGMKSRGFRGTLPNPHQEQKITNFHRHLSNIMGTGAPQLIKKK